jgi:hypothetical protein
VRALELSRSVWFVRRAQLPGMPALT